MSDFSTETQNLQANQYDFPYHYIPDLERKSFLSRHWGFAPSYIAALDLIESRLRPIATATGAEWTHLDIGCGDGALVHSLSKRFAISDGQISGVDIDPRAISWARMFNSSKNFHLGDVSNMRGGYHSGSLVEVLEHVPPASLGQFIKFSVGLVRPGGFMVFTVPSVEKKLAKKHFQHFCFESIQALLNPYFHDLEILAFEKQDLISSGISFLRTNNYARVDSPALNRFLIRRFARLSTYQEGCGRILISGTRI